MEDRIILLNLRKPHYAHFLRYLFDAKASGPIPVTRNLDIGKFLCSQFEVSFLPTKKPESEYRVELQLPVLPHHASENKFIYYSPWREEQINDYIDFLFSIEFREFILQGKENGIMYKFLYEAFMRNKKLDPQADFYEMIKKKDWRRRKKMDDKIKEGLKACNYQTVSEQ